MQTNIQIDDGMWTLSFENPVAKDQLVKGVPNGKKTFAFKEVMRAAKGEEFPLEKCPMYIIDNEAFRIYDVSVTVKALGAEAIAAKEDSARRKSMRRALADAKKLEMGEMICFIEGKRAVRGFNWDEFDEAQQKAIMDKLSALQGKPAAGWKSLQKLTTAFIAGEVSRDEFERLAGELNTAAKARAEKAKAAKEEKANKEEKADK